MDEEEAISLDDLLEIRAAEKLSSAEVLALISATTEHLKTTTSGERSLFSPSHLFITNLGKIKVRSTGWLARWQGGGLLL